MRPHSFSKTLAVAHGISEAIVLKFLAYKTRKSSNLKDDKQWHYNSLDALTEKCPYLGRSTIDDAVKSLAAKGMVEIGNYNKLSFDRTRWYHVPAQYWDAVEERKISFHAADAEVHGVSAAVVMFNLEYWLKKKLKVGKVTHAMSPEKLAKHLPLKASTIKSTLSKLVDVDAVIKVAGIRSEYAFPPDRMRTLQNKARSSK